MASAQIEVAVGCCWLLSLSVLRLSSRLLVEFFGWLRLKLKPCDVVVCSLCAFFLFSIGSSVSNPSGAEIKLS